MSINFQELKKQPIFYKNDCITKPEQSNNRSFSNNSEVNTSKNKKVLIYSLGGLAVLGATALFIRKYKKLPKSSQTESVIDYAKNNLLKRCDVDSLIEKLYPNEKRTFFSALEQFRKEPLSFSSYIKNSENNVSLLNNIFAVNKANKNSLNKFPNVLYLSGVNDNTRRSVTRIMADYYGAEYKQTKYTKGYLKEFIDAIKEYSTDKKANFLYVENIESFVDDLNKPENLEFLNDFKNILKNEKNSTMWVVNKNLDNQIFQRKQINFDFLEGINKYNFDKELSALNSKDYSKRFMQDSDIANAISVYTDKTQALGLSHRTETINVWTFENNKDNYIDKFMDIVTSSTGDKFEKVSAESDIKSVISLINARLPKSQVLFDATEKKTYLYIDNLGSAISKEPENSQAFKELSELLNRTKDSHLTVIIDNNGEAAVDMLVSGNERVKCTAFDLNKIRKNLFDFESLEKGNKHFKQELNLLLQLFDIEKSGRPIPNRNGILLYGDAEKAEIAKNIIQNTLDVNFQESKYDPKEPFESIKKLVAIAEKGEAQYPKTRKRTMINLVGWEELLTHEEDLESIKMIARFKQFVEHCSERYHTTVLLKTARMLDDFETASIATHRFETKIKFK